MENGNTLGKGFKRSVMHCHSRELHSMFLAIWLMMIKLNFEVAFYFCHLESSLSHE